MAFLFEVMFVGVIATIAIDLWAFMLKNVFKIPTTNWGMVGRWLAYLPKGKLIHRPINRSAAIKHEHSIGWIFHYVIGVFYAFLYLFLVKNTLDQEPTLFSATLFGLFTVSVPWLVLQPGLGLGIFATLAEKPWTVRLTNLSIHLIFGAALFFAWTSLQLLAG